MATINDIKKLEGFILQQVDLVQRAWQASMNQLPMEGVKTRRKATHKVKVALMNKASEVLDYCSDLIDHETTMTLNYFYHNILDECSQLSKGLKPYSRIAKCLYAFVNFQEDLVNYEIEKEEDKEKYDERVRQYVNIHLSQNEDRWDEDEKIDGIYKENGSFAMFFHLHDTFEYNLCMCIIEDYRYEKLDDATISTYDVAILIEIVCFYVALKNEEALLSEEEDIYDKTQNSQAPQTTIPAPQGKRTQPVKIPYELNTPKGRKLLQKVIKAGYCDKYYNWDDAKWKEGKSRLALACFAYRASEYLNLSTKTNKEGEPTTSWQPFETLFTYQGKEEGKNKLMQTKRDYMKTKTSFNPEEMDAISKLFR